MKKRKYVIRAFNRMTYSDLKAMKGKISNKHNKDLVLITGAGTTTDIAVMNYEHFQCGGLTIFNVIDEHIISEDLPININPNMAILCTAI